MAKRRSRLDEIRKEMDAQRREENRESIAKRWRFFPYSLDRLINWIGICVLAFILYLIIDSLAGKKTTVDTNLEIILDWKLDIIVPIAVVLFLLFGFARRSWLSKKELRHWENHIELLEEEIIENEEPNSEED